MMLQCCIHVLLNFKFIYYYNSVTFTIGYLEKLDLKKNYIFPHVQNEVENQKSHI